MNTYYLENVRQLLRLGFDEDELRRFCQDNTDFQALYHTIAKDEAKDKIIDLLLHYANQKLKMDILLRWARLQNPARYDKHSPYHTTHASERTLPATQTDKAILIVEDDLLWQEILEEHLLKQGHTIETATTFREARQKLQKTDFALVTIDANLHQGTAPQEGMLLLDYIHQQYGDSLPVIVISGDINRRGIIKAIRNYEVVHVILKDHFEYDELQNAITAALEAH